MTANSTSAIATLVAASQPYHAVGSTGATERLGVEPTVGLHAGEMAQRLSVHGANRLAEPPRRPAWALFVDQFRNVLIVVLMAAAVLAGLVGDFKDTIVISVVLLINAVLGFLQERRTDRSLATLRGMLTPVARVRRGGTVAEIPAEDLVDGDIVLLEAGDRVPADGRVVEAHGVEVDESALTGESTPVAKSTDAVAADAPLAERVGMAHTNTVVTRGRAKIVVTATGIGDRDRQARGDAARGGDGRDAATSAGALPWQAPGDRRRGGGRDLLPPGTRPRPGPGRDDVVVSGAGGCGDP